MQGFSFIAVSVVTLLFCSFQFYEKVNASIDADSLMHFIDIILYQWLNVPEYLHKRSKYMNMKVIVIETTSSFQRFSHEM